MCGLAGIYHFDHARDVPERVLREMISMIQHRGPDGDGYYANGPVGLGHARLSIIDVEGGQQPIHNEDKSIWVVFNGEIFNYIELREELQKSGHEFYTHSDTEVIVHLYEKYGDDFANHLNGQFAIALWDNNKKRLLLVRDRIGINPLFYNIQDKTISFASEVKSLLKTGHIQAKLNPSALDQLMTFWAPVSPETIFDNIYEVSPGQMIIIEKQTVIKKQYWQWVCSRPGDYISGNENELAEQLHDLMIDATKIRLRSDVPVGAYLSGGLDSSVIVALIHHYGGVPLRTFSIGFDDDGLDETVYQKEMIAHLNANHSRVECKHTDIADKFEQTIWHTESPILRTAPIPMSILSGLVRKQDYKVVLTGEGSDEVLGGYDIFKEGKIRQFWAKDPDSEFRPLILKKLYPYLDISKKQGVVYLKNFFGQQLDSPQLPQFAHIPRWVTTAKCKEFFSGDLKEKLNKDVIETMTESLDNRISEWDPFNRSQYIEAKLLMAGYLLCSQGDRMLMSNSVEGRFPFLDHNVIEFANKLDPRVKMKVLNEKYLLKKAMQKYLPPRITKRYKQPYRAPDIPSFFSGKTPDYVLDLLGDQKISEYGYFDAKRVSHLVKKIERGRAIGYKDNMSFIGILSTQMWHYKFIENFTG